MDELLLCTDLDRTLLPNGEAKESPRARERFAQLVEHPEVVLVYVSGRHLASVEAAIQEYGVPRPDYAICDVGTTIFQGLVRSDEGRSSAGRPRGSRGMPSTVEDWRVLESWPDQLRRAWPEGSVARARDLLREFGKLQLQEPERQSEFKLSYYLPEPEHPSEFIDGVQRRLQSHGLEAALIYSVDEGSRGSRPPGLLDLLPPGAGKRAAIQHLLQARGLTPEHAFFAGDSGNDLEVLVSGIPAVLVANAPEDLRRQALEEAADAGNASQLHIARGGFHDMNGNYAAGILEGLAHFHPQTEAWWA